MATKDLRIDAYIEESGEFARPILKHLRKIVHTACPDVEETMKWSFPHFMHQGMLCSMAAFKAHCTFGFWKRTLIFGGNQSAVSPEQNAMGQFGRITTVSDLPNDAVLLGYIKEAVRLNEAGIKPLPRSKPKTNKELTIPDYFDAALKQSKAARAAFEEFSYSHKKEYLDWIVEAKREETRQKRLQTAMTWLAKGKPRHWKYASC